MSCYFRGYSQPRPPVMDSVDNRPFGDMYRGCRVNNSFMTVPPPMTMPPPMTLPPPMTVPPPASSLMKTPPPAILAELERISKSSQYQQVAENETTSDAEKVIKFCNIIFI